MSEQQQQIKEQKFKIRVGLIYQEDLEALSKTIQDVADYYDSITQTIYTGMMILISPLHSPDDDIKKPHYHVYFENKSELPAKSYDKLILQFKTSQDYKGKATIQVKNGKRAMRYLKHLDNPEKEQFPIGNDDLYFINCVKSEIEQYLQVEDDGVTVVEYVLDYVSIAGSKLTMRELIQYCKATYPADVYRKIVKYVGSHSYFIMQLLKEHSWQ